ncbi:MAG: hypothetical protein QMB35_01875 [Porticoccaceae bacterium]
MHTRYLGQNNGEAEFTVRGQAMVTAAQPYRFYQLQTVQDCYHGLSGSEQAVVGSMLQACDMADMLNITLDRRLVQADNLEVWV